jgi:SAM-dependent methyltransferase
VRGAAGRAEHWDAVYAARAPEEVSWFQSEPALSLELVRAAAGPADPVVDVGGGASLLVDRLLELGYESVTVLDVSERALARARERLGPRAARASWVRADAAAYRPAAPVAVWHDRAVFHFLTERADREAYARAAAGAVRRGGTLILAAFAPDGPEKCSGLPVRRCGPDEVLEDFGADFALAETRRETHVTPWGAEQRFGWFALRRR